MSEIVRFSGLQEAIVPVGALTRFGYQGYKQIVKEIPKVVSGFIFGESPLFVHDRVSFNEFMSLEVIQPSKCLITWRSEDGLSIVYDRLDLTENGIKAGIGKVVEDKWLLGSYGRGLLCLDLKLNTFTWSDNNSFGG
jgi:hypothetical protein